MADTRNETMNGLFDRGLALRRQVLGSEYVDGSLKAANEFMMAFQHITTEWFWGYAWGRPGLNLKTRSLLNLAMLTALNRAAEIKLHVRGAINNGVTVDEIKEVLLHATSIAASRPGLMRSKQPMKCLKRWANCLRPERSKIKYCAAHRRAWVIRGSTDSERRD